MDLRQTGCEVVDYIMAYGTMIGSYERSCESSGSINVGEFLDQLNDYQLLKILCYTPTPFLWYKYNTDSLLTTLANVKTYVNNILKYVFGDEIRGVLRGQRVRNFFIWWGLGASPYLASDTCHRSQCELKTLRAQAICIRYTYCLLSHSNENVGPATIAILQQKIKQ